MSDDFGGLVSDKTSVLESFSNGFSEEGFFVGFGGIFLVGMIIFLKNNHTLESIITFCF